jgi:hypothetical protein
MLQSDSSTKVLHKVDRYDATAEVRGSDVF